MGFRNTEQGDGVSQEDGGAAWGLVTSQANKGKKPCGRSWRPAGRRDGEGVGVWGEAGGECSPEVHSAMQCSLCSVDGGVDAEEGDTLASARGDLSPIFASFDGD